MNIFVEGLQGTGKTTLLNRLSEHFPQLPTYREGDVCPVELAWCAYLDQSAFADAKQAYPLLAPAMDALAVIEGDHVILPYTRIHGAPEFFSAMEQHEIYNGRIPLTEFKEIILRRFTAHQGGGLFECALLQNIVETMLLYYTLSEADILAFYQDIWCRLQDKGAIVLYLDAADVARNIDTARRERVDDQGREVWFAMLMDFFRASPLAQQRGWTHREHLLEYFHLRQRIERRILTEIVGDAAIILPEKCYDLGQIVQMLKKH